MPEGKPEDEFEEDESMTVIAEFLQRHEKQIAMFLEAWAKNFERDPTRRLWVIFGVLALAGVTLILIGYLTVIGRVSSDAFTFLIGSVIGYLFSYLKNISSQRLG